MSDSFSGRTAITAKGGCQTPSYTERMNASRMTTTLTPSRARATVAGPRAA
jgi:hypothetical protein